MPPHDPLIQPPPRCSPDRDEARCIVIVEDDAELRDLILCPLLFDAGYAVVGVGSAAELFRHLAVARCDLALIDIGLPDESGLDVARHLRQSSDIGIVLLTGRGDDLDQVRGLNLGADGFLCKPVDSTLLLATINNITRRLKAAKHQPKPPTWRLDPQGWRLQSPDGGSIDLTHAEHVVMRHLVQAQGRPVTREVLIADLTRGEAEFDPHRLEATIHRLRRKVGGISGVPLPIRAIRGVGYLLDHD